MRVWWCAVRGRLIHSETMKCRHEGLGCQRMDLHPAGSRVVSGEALVVEKVNGEWPEWAIAAMYAVPDPQPNFPIALLDALADKEAGL